MIIPQTTIIIPPTTVVTPPTTVIAPPTTVIKSPTTVIIPPTTIPDELVITNLLVEKDEIIKTHPMTEDFTTINSQNNDVNNYSNTIYFEDCKSLLKKIYNISINETFLFHQQNIIHKGIELNIMEKKEYCKIFGTNIVILNLTLCMSYISQSIDKLINNICIDSINDNYYLELDDKLYKLCYYTNQIESETIHNYDECINNYLFFNELSNYLNKFYDYSQIKPDNIEQNIITNIIMESKPKNYSNYYNEVTKKIQEKIINKFETTSIDNGDDFFFFF